MKRAYAEMTQKRQYTREQIATANEKELVQIRKNLGYRLTKDGQIDHSFYNRRVELKPPVFIK